MLTRKLANVGFEAIAVVDRRPCGLAALARYPVFPASFMDFLRSALLPDRHDALVYTLVLTARKPVPAGDDRPCP